jgi:hypothetical protein
MNKQKVIEINSNEIIFENQWKLYSNHDQDCCETHYLDFSYQKLEDFEGLEFDLDSDLFSKIDGYGIELIPLIGFTVKIPGYGSNNGFYSSDLELILADSNGTIIKKWDITDCQEIEY